MKHIIIVGHIPIDPEFDFRMGGSGFIDITEGSIEPAQIEIELDTTDRRSALWALLLSLQYCERTKVKDVTVYLNEPKTFKEYHKKLPTWVKSGYTTATCNKITNADFWRQVNDILPSFNTINIEAINNTGHLEKATEIIDEIESKIKAYKANRRSANEVVPTVEYCELCGLNEADGSSSLCLNCEFAVSMSTQP